MSDREPAVTAATATRDVADPPPSPAGPRPFSRPTPTDDARRTAAPRRTPFLVPAGNGAARADVALASSQTVRPGAAMTWVGSAELDAANALEAVARRLRAGTLRLPVAVDPRVAPAVLAAVLAALHAETRSPDAPASDPGVA